MDPTMPWTLTVFISFRVKWPLAKADSLANRLALASLYTPSGKEKPSGNVLDSGLRCMATVGMTGDVDLWCDDVMVGLFNNDVVGGVFNKLTSSLVNVSNQGKCP